MTSIHPTAIISEGAELGAEVTVGAYSILGPHVRVGDGATIMPHVFVDGWTTIGGGCTVFPFASVGTQTQDLKFKGGKTFVVIGARTTLREYVTVNSGTADGESTVVGEGCHIMACAHVAHGCRVGNGVIMANGALLAGHVQIEDGAVLGGMSGVHQFVRIGRMAMVGACTKVTQDVPPFMIVDGNPPAVHGLNKIALQRKGVPDAAQHGLKIAYKCLYRDGLTTTQALERIESERDPSPEVAHLVAFVRASERGILK